MGMPEAGNGNQVAPRSKSATRGQISAQLQQLMRDPFREVLVEFLEGKPSPEAIAEFADKSPDRWAQAIAIFGRLAGFHEKVEIDKNINITIAQMGDAELLEHLDKLRAQKDIEGAIDVTPPEITDC